VTVEKKGVHQARSCDLPREIWFIKIPDRSVNSRFRERENDRLRSPAES